MSEENGTNTNTTLNILRRGDIQTQPFNDLNSPYVLHPSDNLGTVFMTCVLNEG